MAEQQLPEGWVSSHLGELFELNYGKSLSDKLRDGKLYPVYGSNGVVGHHSTPLVQREGLIIGRKGSFGVVHKST